MAVTANAMKGDRDKCIQVPLPSEEGTTKRFQDFLPESQGQNLALTVLFVQNSLDRISHAMKGDRDRRIQVSTGEKRGDTLHYFKGFRSENGSRQGQNVDFTGSIVPWSLDSGYGWASAARSAVDQIWHK